MAIEQTKTDWQPTIDINKNVSSSFVEPELAVLMHFLMDEPVDFRQKVEATKMLIGARIQSGLQDQEAYTITFFELLLGAAGGLAAVLSTPKALGGSESYSSIWQSGLCSLVPSIIQTIQAERTDVVRSDSELDDIEKACHLFVEKAKSLMDKCEVHRKATNSDKQNDVEKDADPDTIMMDSLISSTGGEGSSERSSIQAMLVQSLVDRDAVRLDRWQTGKHSLAEAEMLLRPSQITMDAKHMSMTVSEYTSQRLLSGEALDDPNFVEAIESDYSTQDQLCRALMESMLNWANNNELEPLSRACSMLLESSSALQIWLFFVSPAQALQPICVILDNPDLLQSGEDPSVLAPIVLFGQFVIQIGLGSGASLEDLCPSSRSRFLPSVMRSLTATRPLDRLSKMEQETVANWITALFGSDGISDDLIRASSPQLLMRIAPTIFSQAIIATSTNVIDMDTLRGGLTYFLQDLLSYTLPGALRSVANQIQRGQSGENADAENSKKYREVCIEVLRCVLLDESCSVTIKRLVSQQIVAVLEKDQLKAPLSDAEQGLLQHFIPFNQSQTRRTDIWIKGASSTMLPSTLDPLLNMNASLYSIMTQRGLDAVVSLLRKSEKSVIIQKPICFSLALIALQDTNQPKSSLADENTIRIITQLLQQDRSIDLRLLLTLCQAHLPHIHNAISAFLQLENATKKRMLSV
ncbi:Med5-domain-containing protein [Meira miltonrushii]|uniref:Mediator of RNA polymerase II transcription subunit 5 n=1 Tax=Meira miltonrushii TaxID=1280837 RepID=A0A316VJT3_9BASI|nr:Med5-domain-containing protein [Meira miltonrushii]PWN35765.1 Med5-domain-containing protein [Meira miltonrushii]